MKKITYFFGLLLVIQACLNTNIDPDNSGGAVEFEDIPVPESFDFNTSQGIEVLIQDTTSGVRYDLYTLESDTINLQLASGSPYQGLYRTFITLPSSSDKLYLVRNERGRFSSQELSVQQGRAEFTYDKSLDKSGRIAKNGCVEMLYAVNNNGGFYRINAESGNYETEELPNLVGGGSIACAVDRANRKCYYNTGTTLRYFDIDEETFHTVSTGNPFNGSYPRMEYDNTTGLMYIASNARMYQIDPLNNTLLNTFNIVGLENPVGGGDVAISLDGTMYMCCFSGLYRIEIVNNQANATRISAENLPFQPTSMCIDRSDRLYMGTNGNASQLIEMDKFDGSWVVRKEYDHKINDLGSLPCTVEELENRDTDEDGIIDALDDYPEDAEKAFESFTPSKLGWGSLGFEDLWPAKGDFDFNDLVMNYRYISVNNAQNQVVELDIKFQVKNIGASFTNGFGVQIPIDPNLIQSVTGFNLTEGLVQLNANGTEANQSQAVIIVFDNAFRNGNTGECNNRLGEEININIRFVNPIAPESLGEAPFNPFIFVNGERSHEVHLADKAPTDLADLTLFGTFNDDSNPATQKYYKDELNHPWAINIIHDFRVPREKRKIYQAYNRFQEWAMSGGVNFRDWYKDNSGYRNTSLICLD